jgi:hypothetical protein
LWKEVLPSWLVAEWDSAVECVLLEPEMLDYSEEEGQGQVSPLQKTAALFFVVQTRLGPRNREEQASLLRKTEHPMSVLCDYKGQPRIPGSEWAGGIEQWLKDAHEIDEASDEQYRVRWNLVSIGVNALTVEVLTHCNERESHLLNAALDRSGILEWTPRYEDVRKFVVQLLAILKTSAGIRALRVPSGKGPGKTGQQGAQGAQGTPAAHAAKGLGKGDEPNQPDHQPDHAKGRGRGRGGGKKGAGRGGKGGKKGSGSGCFTCGSHDHWSRECPQKKDFGDAPAGGAASPP